MRAAPGTGRYEVSSLRDEGFLVVAQFEIGAVEAPGFSPANNGPLTTALAVASRG